MKKISNYVFILLIGIIFSGSRCHESFDSYEISIYNKSEQKIFCSHILESFPNCEDTLLHIYGGRGTLIPIDSSFHIDLGSLGKCDTMRLFILDLDTIAKYSWEKIREDNIILKRYDISTKDLKDKGSRTIIYP